ncbi:MAG: hypothetical protein OXT67_09885 [Zetaproteobacteria bacterium]|nr:hypothetical protein [Zetaproteobacteria bacterium]
MWIDNQVIDQCEQQLVVKVWVPEQVCVVLGRSNKATVEVREQHCLDDRVPILQRKGGGGTVVLHPGCVVLSAGMWVRDYYKNQNYFEYLNSSVIDVLSVFAAAPSHVLSQNGISDITLNGKKIVGTSLFRSRHYLLYQASLLVDARIDCIEKYLNHPSKEPEYRRGRPHRQFVTGLHQECYTEKTVQEVSFSFYKLWKLAVHERMEQHLVEPLPSQMRHHDSSIQSSVSTCRGS